MDLSILPPLTEVESCLWQTFIARESLTALQADQFLLYYTLLQQGNQITNLTALTGLADTIEYHFRDSLAVRSFIIKNRDHITGIADVGTGAGFPGIALKIIFPELPLILIEVNGKKVAFLRDVIGQLGLTDVFFVTCDWRTFLRTTSYSWCNFFVSRASLPASELIRLFAPSTSYSNALCCYWGSAHWASTVKEQPFISEKLPYRVGTKDRVLVFMQKPEVDLCR